MTKNFASGRIESSDSQRVVDQVRGVGPEPEVSKSRNRTGLETKMRVLGFNLGLSLSLSLSLTLALSLSLETKRFGSVSRQTFLVFSTSIWKPKCRSRRVSRSKYRSYCRVAVLLILGLKTCVSVLVVVSTV